MKLRKLFKIISDDQLIEIRGFNPIGCNTITIRKCKKELIKDFKCFNQIILERNVDRIKVVKDLLIIYTDILSEELTVTMYSTGS